MNETARLLIAVANVYEERGLAPWPLDVIRRGAREIVELEQEVAQLRPTKPTCPAPRCGNPLSGRQEYCSPACRSRMWRERKRNARPDLGLEVV